MRGWLLVDVGFGGSEARPREVYTFAREVDRSSDWRWQHDWRVVDVDGEAYAGDRAALLAGLSGGG